MTVENHSSSCNCKSCGGACCKVWFVLEHERNTNPNYFIKDEDWEMLKKQYEDFDKRVRALKTLAGKIRYLCIDDKFLVSAVNDECKYLVDGKCTIYEGDRPDLCKTWGNKMCCDLSRKVLEMMKE